MPAHEPNRALTRHKLESLAWQHTPADYRSESGSRRQVLLNTTEGTTLVPLASMTDYQLRRYIGPKRLEEAGDMRKNARPQSEPLAYDRQLLDQLVQMTAESMEIPHWQNAEATPEVVRVAQEYDKALLEALEEVVEKYPPKNGADAEELFDANAPYLVLMTLQGQGVGIWDGEWDRFYDDTKRVGELLKKRLRQFCDETGAGTLEEAFLNAAVETTGHTPNASRRREEPDETAAHELCLYIENEYDLIAAPNSQGTSIKKSLKRKLDKGTFDLKKSEDAWMYLMEAGAKKYTKEFGSGDWHRMFNKPTRELAAHYFATSFYEEWKLGNV